MTWDDVLDLSDVAQIISLSLRHTGELARGDDFPEPRKVSGNVRLWDSEDVAAWIAEHRTRQE